MDDKGYAFTPMAFLLIVPVMIIAISYSGIVNELNMISQIAMGGDVTFGVADNIMNTLQKSLGDAGRNATFNATRTVIDKETVLNGRASPYFADSRTYIKSVVANDLNGAIIETCKDLNATTARNIYIDGKLVTNTTSDNASLITANDILIYQTDPFGFYISLKKGIPITVTQNDQNFTGYTSNITAYVSLEGMEDPYVWVNSLDRRSNVIYEYPFYESAFNDYHFDDDSSYNKITKTAYLQHLWDCLNGTNNTGNLSGNVYYFYDPSGLTFFDRLENKTYTASLGPNAAKMSTFIQGDPLVRDINGVQVSCLDHEYFAGTTNAVSITVKGYTFYDTYSTPTPFYISQKYLTALGLNTSY